jgi:general secretion pathway protein K
MRSRQRTVDSPGNASGVVLIALLWIFVALSAIVMSFARESRVEILSARNSEDLGRAYYIARAAVSETIYRMAYERLGGQSQQLGQDTEPTFLQAGILKGAFGGGRFEVNIQDESGKLDLNAATEEQLRSLCLALGIGESDASTIVDSIMDWRDTDTEQRMNGAEEGYYRSLPTPYSPKNGRMESVEELLLVRGVTPEYFYGKLEQTEDGSTVYKYGLSRCLTVYAGTGGTRINVNYAPLAVLLSIPNMTRADAERIIASRPFQNTGEISDAIPGTLSAGTTQYLSTQLTDIYTLNVTAYARNSEKDSGVKRVLRVVVRLDRGRPNYHQILYWNENVPDYQGTNL